MLHHDGQILFLYLVESTTTTQFIMLSSLYSACFHISGTFAKVLISFSAITNGQKILTVGNIKKDISCLHGIRVLSMWWVILGHSYAFSMYNMGKCVKISSILYFII
jgi:hypothetical protein